MAATTSLKVNNQEILAVVYMFHVSLKIKDNLCERSSENVVNEEERGPLGKLEKW